MKKIIFREAEYTETSFLYDNDGIKEISGKNNALYIVNNYDFCPVNKEEYKNITRRADEIATDFCDLVENLENGYAPYYFTNFKEICKYHGIKYSPIMVKRLKEWAKTFDNDLEQIADFLTITTGEKWNTYTVTGYSQGEHATGIYCVGHYDDNALELYVGAAAGTVTEFYRIEGDDVLGGIFVTDRTKWNTEALKKELASYEGDDPDEITIELFDGYYQTAKYKTI